MIRKLLIIVVFLFAQQAHTRQVIVYNSGCSVTEAGTELTCDDNIDNDCDGLKDTDDSDCAAGYCGTAGDTYYQTLEGAGYPANGAWGDETETVSASGVLDEDHTSDVVAGSQALLSDVNAEYHHAYFRVVPDADIASYYASFHFTVKDHDIADGETLDIAVTLGNSRYTYLQLINSSGTIYLRYQYYQASPAFGYVNSSNSATGISIDTRYNVEVYFDSGTPAWELRLDEVTVDSDTDNILGDIGTDGYLQVGLDPPAGQNNASIVYDCIYVESTDWLGP